MTRIMRFCWTTSLGLTIITKFLLSLIASRPLTVCSRCRSLCLGLSASLAWPQESSSVLKQVIRTLFVSLSLSPYSGRLRLTCICLINHPSCSHAPHRAHRLHRGTYSCTQSDNACAFHSPSCPRARFPGAKLDRGIQRRLLARLGCRVSRRFWFTPAGSEDPESIQSHFHRPHSAHDSAACIGRRCWTFHSFLSVSASVFSRGGEAHEAAGRVCFFLQTAQRGAMEVASIWLGPEVETVEAVNYFGMDMGKLAVNTQPTHATHPLLRPPHTTAREREREMGDLGGAGRRSGAVLAARALP